TGGELRLKRLMSLLEMEYENAYLGKKIELSYPELGISGRGEVLLVEECSPFTSRPSPKHCLVTTTFEHSASNLMQLSIHGLPEPVLVTSNHPIWSADKRAFVQAGSLRVGEYVKNIRGIERRVIGAEPFFDVQKVYNLEVNGENVYHVGTDGILVHNSKTY